MNRKNWFFRITGAMVLLTMLLTSCAKVDFSSDEVIVEFPSLKNSAEQNTEDEDFAEKDDLSSGEIEQQETPDFQKLFESVELPDGFADSTRYVLVNDYDRDGRSEAFGFVGKPNEYDENRWDDLQIYYMDADGGIAPVHTHVAGDGGYMFSGGPYFVTDSGNGVKDFSSSYFDAGDNVFLLLDVCYDDDMYYSGLQLSVYQGNYTESYADGSPQKLEDGRIVVNEWDDEIEYVVREGCLVRASTVS